MKKSAYIAAALFLLASLVAACGQQKKSNRTDTYSSGTMPFVADESFSPIIEEFRQVFEYTYPNAHMQPKYISESEAVEMLLQDKICLAVTARDYKPLEKQTLLDKKYLPQSFPIAYDGFALIVNNSNPDTCISVKNIREILQGKLTTWKQFNPASKLGEIILVFDNKKSSTVHYAEDSILGGKAITAPGAMAVKKTADVIDYVEKTPEAIGIIGSNWLNDSRDTTNLTFKRNIRTMSVSRLDKATSANSWKPYQYYIYNGNYPLCRTIYCLLNDPYRGLPWGFAHFMESPQGQMIVLKTGLLPVKGNLTFRQVHVNDD